MFISYDLYRSKDNTIFNQEKIEFNLELNDQLLFIDDLINNLLSNHIANLEIIKKNGIAYVGGLRIVELEITNKDNIEMNEEEFRDYMKNIMPLLVIKWNKNINKKGD